MKSIQLFAIVILIVAFTSCSLFKSTYYNELNEEEKKKYTPMFLDLENHESNTDGVYSLNIDEFRTLLKNSSNKLNFINFYRIYCQGNHDMLKDFSEKFDLYKFDRYFISGNDWVYKNDYLEIIENSSISRFYLLDVNKYGHLDEGWHDGITFFERNQAFYNDLRKVSVLDSNENKEYSYPNIMICDNDSNILLEFDPNGCDGKENCFENEDTFYNSLDSLLNSKLSLE